METDEHQDLRVVREDGAHNPSTCQQSCHTSYSQFNIKEGSCREMVDSGERCRKHETVVA